VWNSKELTVFKRNPMIDNYRSRINLALKKKQHWTTGGQPVTGCRQQSMNALKKSQAADMARARLFRETVAEKRSTGPAEMLLANAFCLIRIHHPGRQLE
jgi:hypothetical protein